MELLRGKIVEFLLIAISMTICTTTGTVIIYMYAVIRFVMGTLPAGVISQHFPLLVLGITTLFHLCYSAHLFTLQVQRVSSQLRDMRLAVRDEETRVQLHYLISTLERMETFDMGSWYHLGPNTLVSVATFVLTYLVVLLQVGNEKTQLEPGPKANTTAG